MKKKNIYYNKNKTFILDNLDILSLQKKRFLWSIYKKKIKGFLKRVLKKKKGSQDKLKREQQQKKKKHKLIEKENIKQGKRGKPFIWKWKKPLHREKPIFKSERRPRRFRRVLRKWKRYRLKVKPNLKKNKIKWLKSQKKMLFKQYLKLWEKKHNKKFSVKKSFYILKQKYFVGMLFKHFKAKRFLRKEEVKNEGVFVLIDVKT